MVIHSVVSSLNVSGCVSEASTLAGGVTGKGEKEKILHVFAET